MVVFEQLRNDVLTWLDSLKVPESNCRYMFYANADDTIFCTCFALFILDLFKETTKFSNDESNNWISYIQSFQNKEYGYFEPEKYYHIDKERNRYQLTCFCLSALGILGAAPKFPMKFLEQWKTPDDVKKYLYDRDSHKGKPGSGNKAMFLAIFLTYEYERAKYNRVLDKINAWFEFHNETQNKKGFWGTNLKSHYLHGLQNGLHQFIIYFYWRKDIPKEKNREIRKKEGLADYYLTSANAITRTGDIINIDGIGVVDFKILIIEMKFKRTKFFCYKQLNP